MNRAFAITLAVLGAALLFAALALLWIRDAPLDDPAGAWLTELGSQPEHSAGYIYLLGLDAAAEPQRAGQALLDEYRRWRAMHSYLDFFPSKPGKVLPIPNFPAQPDEPGLCRQPEREAALLEQGGELLARYQQVARFADLRSLLVIEPSAPLPNYKVLLAGNRLLALEACRLLRDGQGEAARDLLEADLGHWRRHLAGADSLIQKMVVIRLIAGNLETLGALYQQGLIERPAAQAPLTTAERSLEGAMRNEFAILANGFTAMYDEPRFRDEHGGRLAISLLFKSNMSSNAVLPRYLSIANASQLTASEFALWLRQQPIPPLHEDWRNPIGNILAAVAMPDLRQYLARLHDLDARIQLYNRLNHLTPGFSVAEALSVTREGNPYASGPARLVESSPPQLCYDGPLADPKRQRCLPLFGFVEPAATSSVAR